MAFLAIMPGLLLTVRWALVAPAVVIENQGPLKCLGRSNELVKGNGWRVFFLLLVTRALGSMTGILAHTLPNYGVVEVAMRLVLGALGALGVVTLGVMFFELRRLKEAQADIREHRDLEASYNAP